MTIILSDLVNPIAPPEDKVAVQANSVTLSSKVTNLNFTGAGVTTSNVGDSVTVDVPGASAATPVAVLDEGGQLTSTATSLNFTGAGVTATNTGGAVTVNVPGSAGGSVSVKANGTLVTSGVTNLNLNGFKVTNSGSDVTVVPQNPMSEVVTQTAHGFPLWKCLYKSETESTFSTAWSSRGFVGIVSQVIDANTFVITYSGPISGLSGLVADADYSINNGNLERIVENSYAGLMCDIGKNIPVLKATGATTAYVYEKSYHHDYTIYNDVFAAGSLPSSLTKQTLCYVAGSIPLNVTLASAASESSLATHVVGAMTTNGTAGCFVLSSGNPTGWWKYTSSLPLVEIVADNDTKVYLSETPGEVTLTPPAIRQVVGIIQYGSVKWVEPYREFDTLITKDEDVNLTSKTKSLNFVGSGVTATNSNGDVTVTIPGSTKITTSTVAPSNPSIGDIWVDIN